MTTGKIIALTRRTFISKVMSILFNVLPRLVITFLTRGKHLFISWLQSPSAVILEHAKSQTRLRTEHIHTKMEKGLTLGKFQEERMQAEGNTEAKNSTARKGMNIQKAFSEPSLQRLCFSHFLLLMHPFLQGSVQQEFSL